VNACVVDASVAIKWFVPEDHSEPARRLFLRGRAGDLGLHVPDIFVAEIGNIVWKKVRRRELAHDDAWEVAAAVLAALAAVYASRALLASALAIALTNGRTLYDSLYVALADSLGCPLVTADRRFVNVMAGTPLGRSVVWIEDI
jgi:predicted nucleic acid-binding protein